ncbi:MAG: hypothetical protein EHM62_03135, partial [Methylococcus sp.]
MLYWYLPGVLFQTIFSHLEFLNQAAYNFKKIFYGYFAKQLFMLFFIGIIYFYFQNEIDLRILSFGQSLSILIGLLIMLYKAFRLQILITSVSKIRIKELLNYGKFIFGSGLMATIFANVDQLLTASVL